MANDNEKSALVLTATFLVPVFFWTGVLFASLLQLHEKRVELLISFGAAVGTISAVIVALSVGKRQVAAALDAVERSHLIAARLKQQSFLAVAEAAYQHAEMVRKLFSYAEPRRTFELQNGYHKVTTDVITNALERVPVHEIGIAAGIAPLLRLQYRFGFLHQAIVNYQTDPQRNPDLLIKHQAADTPQRQAWNRTLLEQGQTVYANNVLDHVDRIAEDYLECARALASV